MSEFDNSSHPLGHGINREETPELVSRLSRRLPVQGCELATMFPLGGQPRSHYSACVVSTKPCMK